MKALTLTQPYATLVAIGAKLIETRSWRTGYRGPLAIHAAAGFGPLGGKQKFEELCGKEPFRTVLNEYAERWFQARGDLADMVAHPLMPHGMVIAVCELCGCVATELLVEAGGAWDLETADERITDGKGKYYNRHYVSADHGKKWKLTDQERAFGDYSEGRYAWLLADVRPLRLPVPAKGQLGLWEWTPPPGGAAVKRRRSITGAQRIIHWRFTIYQSLIGVDGLYKYRLWLWNRTIAYRELNRRRRAERQSHERLMAYRRLHYLDGAIYGYDTKDRLI